MQQLNLFEEEPKQPELVKLEDGEYLYIPDFFSESDSNHFLEILLKEIEWKQQEMQLYGKTVKFPRLTAWYGENDKPYSFSGITLNPHNWTDPLIQIKEQIEDKAKTSFNSVLLNLYRDGSDSISWHTDAEKELGKNPVIASVNFGASRKFQLRHIKTKQKIELILDHGSLLIMQGELQHYWQHQVPKTKQPVKHRINLTFRTII